MDSGKKDFGVTIKEALHIKFKKPTINRQLISDGSSYVLNVLQSRKYIGEKSPGSLSPLLRLVGRHVHDACSVRPRRTLPL